MWEGGGSWASELRLKARFITSRRPFSHPHPPPFPSPTTLTPAVSIVPMNTPNATPRAPPMTQDRTVRTAQLFSWSSAAICSGLGMTMGSYVLRGRGGGGHEGGGVSVAGDDEDGSASVSSSAAILRRGGGGGGGGVQQAARRCAVCVAVGGVWGGDRRQEAPQLGTKKQTKWCAPALPLAVVGGRPPRTPSPPAKQHRDRRTTIHDTHTT